MNKFIYPESTSIYAYCYSHTSQILTINFVSGGTYEYYRVPPAVWEAMLAQPSVGQYFNKFIRNKFDSVEIVQPLELRA